MIRASFKAAGPLEKPDVIGAIFGQTEGLLGSDLEMRELQKEGRIGRIEVELETVDGKSVGEIQVPTAMDKSETTLIAAALETIDRIGPTEASIEITKIEDVRGSKRDYILERAKKLMAGVDDSGSFREMSESLKEESRTEKISEYGTSRLPAGDLNCPEIIVVEGRADVINLLRNRVNNVVGMDGAKLPPEIAELSKTKEITLFVDGDRGGKLIAGNVCDNAKVRFIASAPEGKEVEELTGKEILMSLRKRVLAVDFFRNGNGRSFTPTRDEPNRGSPTTELKFNGDVKEKLREVYDKKIKGDRGALLLDDSLDVIKKIGSREIARNVKSSHKKIGAIIVDGSATASVVRLCDEFGIPFLAAVNFVEGADGTKVELIGL